MLERIIEKYRKHRSDRAAIMAYYERRQKRLDGGPGSGNWGHQGRKGKRGGSVGGGGKHNRLGNAEEGYTSFSKNKKKLATPHEVSIDEYIALPAGTKILDYGDGHVYVKESQVFTCEDGYSVLNAGDIVGKEFSFAIPDSANPNYNKVSRRNDVDTEDYRRRSEETFSVAKDLTGRETDELLFNDSARVWKACSDDEKDSIYRYTDVDYIPMNKYLRGMGVDENYMSEGVVRKKVENMTSALDKASLEHDMIFQRGTSSNAFRTMFGLSDATPINEDTINNLVGATGVDNGFTSCGSKPGKGMDKGVTYLIFAPKGTKAMYVENCSAFGNGQGKEWDGETRTDWFSSEMETIIQRGTTYQLIGTQTYEGSTMPVLAVVDQNYGSIDSIVKHDGVNYDGGPGSGNHNHEGRPGQRGGSAPTGEGLKKNISDALASKDAKTVKDAFSKTFESMPIGSSMEAPDFDCVFTKKGQNKWESKFGWGEKDEMTVKEMNTTAFLFAQGMNYETDFSFTVPDSDDVKAAMVKSGDLKPEPTISNSYNGKTNDYVSREEYSSRKEQFQRNAEREFSDDEVAKMVNAVTEYTGVDYVGILAAQTGFGGRYENYSNAMSQENKDWALETAELAEKAIRYSDKYNGQVKRAIGFDLDGWAANVEGFDEISSKLTEGNVIQMDTMTSWTTKDYVVKDILTYRTLYDDECTSIAEVVMSCKSKTGVDIAELSSMHGQYEVLFGKNTQFRVKNVKKTESYKFDGEVKVTRLDVELEEVV